MATLEAATWGRGSRPATSGAERRSCQELCIWKAKAGWLTSWSPAVLASLAGTERHGPAAARRWR